MPTITGFAPISQPTAQLLILGSMPSDESLQQQQYYAHPRNQFWQLLSDVLQTPLSTCSYPDKQQALHHHKIALWDVVQQCEREGSLDSAIVFDSITPNNFADFFADHPFIRAIFFNGRKAEQLFLQLVLPELRAEYQQLPTWTLPSSSPAHARLDRLQKLQKWLKIKQFIRAKSLPEPNIASQDFSG